MSGHRRSRWGLWGALLALACGCAQGGGASDAGPAPAADAGRRDAGGRDAAVATRDGGAPDAGPPPDAGPVCEAEVCNGADDDCDGEIDEVAGCPCVHRTRLGRAYLFCDDAASWTAARAACDANGYSLAVLDDPAEDAFVFNQMFDLSLGSSWVGLNDRAIEGQWVWLDGLPIGYEHWDAGEPNDGAGGEDCGLVMMDEGRRSEWDDRACASERDYVCEAPAP